MQTFDTARIDTVYRSPEVRARIAEFLGGDTISNATCRYVAPLSHEMGLELPRAYPPESAENIENYPLGLARSTWDRRSLIADIDIEYVNFDFPAEPYLDPHRTFELLNPVHTAILATLREFGLHPLRVITGRGFHYLWSIAQHGPVFESLVRIGSVHQDLDTYYRAHTYFDGVFVDTPLGKAYSGIGMVIEFLMHLVLHRITGLTRIPVTVTAVSSVPSCRGREIVSLDISEYADPLNTRVIQVPFTPYCKHLIKGGIVHEGIRDRIPVMVPVPINGIALEQGIETMRDVENAADHASRTHCRIPPMTDQTSAAVDAYNKSTLANFHRYFYSQSHESVNRWPVTYDEFDLTSLPPCIATILSSPNDLLATPAGMQQVVRSLFAKGWHPRHIAGLIRSKFERDYGWGNQWYAYNASVRADVYTRIFSGLIALGIDDLHDFTCDSTKNKGYCFNPDMNCGLRALQKAAIERRIA